MTKPSYKFKANSDIGNLEAELDKFLIDGFVEKSDYQILRNVSDSKSIILGRTGSGKSALIRKIIEDEESIKQIDPEALSLRHLSNSNIINYFSSIDIKLDLFYKVLWRHVLIVELIKLHYGDFEGNANRLIRALRDKFRKDRAKTKALDYLEAWENTFWQKTEHQIKEVETNLEKAFKAELGGGMTVEELYKLSSGIGGEVSKNKRTLIEVKHKAQKVVNELQVDDLNEVIRLFRNDIFPKTQRRYFLLIDDLDKDWVDVKIVYELIRALLEVIREFSRIPQAKVIVALRTNIDEIIHKVNLIRGTQREKTAYLHLKITWDLAELEALINNRLKLLMKETYTQKAPTLKDLLPENTKMKGDAFKYMLERTFMRPRDIIDFFNRCIEYSRGKSKITWETIKKSEEPYSTGRIKALNDEWLENHGSLTVLYGFLKNGPPSFSLSEVHDKSNSYFVGVISNDEIRNLNDDWIKKFEAFGKDYKPIPLLKEILATLYNVGLIGAKRYPESSMDYIHESYVPLEPIDIDKEYPKFNIHPMFWRALRIKVKAR